MNVGEDFLSKIPIEDAKVVGCFGQERVHGISPEEKELALGIVNGFAKPRRAAGLNSGYERPSNHHTSQQEADQASSPKTNFASLRQRSDSDEA
jgi:hypothetical protein